MGMFHGTVGFYRQYRPGIPKRLAEILDVAAPSRSPRRLLDVGTGTGLVVETLLDRFDDIVAFDNDPDMLAAAEAALRPQLPNGTTLLLQEINAEEYTPRPGWRAELVTICRAFHWLNQAAVLHRLGAQVSPDGAVAIFGDNSFWVATSPWKAAIRSIIQEFLGEQRRAGNSTFQHHKRPYSEIMQESPFNQVEEFMCLLRSYSRLRADSCVAIMPFPPSHSLTRCRRLATRQVELARQADRSESCHAGRSGLRASPPAYVVQWQQSS